MKKPDNAGRWLTGLILILLFSVTSLKAQFIEDALRLNYGMLGSGTRALSMGTAYLAIADDYSATFHNPAGLPQIRKFEFTGGLRHTSFDNDVGYLGSVSNISGSSTALDHLGFVIPVPTLQGSLTFAIGYNRLNDFTLASSFEGYNAFDSIIPDLFYSRDMMSTFLDLADSSGNYFYDRDFYQKGLLEESGSVSNWNIGGGIEVVPDFYLGMSLNLLTGKYRHIFRFEEEDVNRYYTIPPDDLDYLLVEDRINTRITGFNVIFGGFYKVNSFMRLGGTIQTPTRYSLEEDYSTYGYSRFSDPNDFLEDEFDAYIEYDVSTPWKFGAGISVDIARFTLAAAVDYQDWTQLEFRNAPRTILDNNRYIREDLEGTTNIRLGAEYRLPMFPVALRGGYIIEPSPYRNAIPEMDRKYITGGIGIRMQNTVELDLGITYGLWESELYLYEFPAGNTWLPRFANEDVSKRSVTFSLKYIF